MFFKYNFNQSLKQLYQKKKKQFIFIKHTQTIVHYIKHLL